MTSDLENVQLVPEKTVFNLTTAVLIAALTAVLAQLSIQLPGGVPFSFQPFGVFFAGLLLGPVWGGFAMLLYVIVGIAGAPVFSNAGAGLGYFLGPTGGFLVGFIFAAIVIGAITHRRITPRSLSSLPIGIVAVALFVSLIPIYAVGVPWLAEIQGWSLARAATFMAPFFGGDVMKVIIAVLLVAGNAKLLDEYR